MKRVIVSCRCGDTDEFAKSAYHLLFPDTELPEFLSGKAEVSRLYNELPNNTMSEHLLALLRSPQKYARYMEYEDDLLVEWDLIKGERIC